MSSQNQTDPQSAKGSMGMTNTLFIIIVSTFVIFIIYKYFFGEKTKQKNSIVIIGPSQSGKTSFFYYLLGKEKTETVVSMQINEVSNYQASAFKGKHNYIDIPGQGYFKETILEKIQEALLIILFVDSTEKNSTVTAAEYLYDILNSDKFDPEIPIVIACNKQDLNLPKNKKMIENNLATELENLKKIKQKNHLEEQAEVGALFQMKKRFDFQMFKNISFVETDKNTQFASLILSCHKVLYPN